MNIEIIGKGERMTRLCRLARGLTKRHLLLLPIPSTKDGKTVFSTDIGIYDALSSVQEGSIVACYRLPEKYKKYIICCGGRVLDMYYDEDFLTSNARLTALGALGYILTNSEREIKDLRIGIVGYGRIGSRLLEMLLYLGAHVTVYSRRDEVRCALAESGAVTSSDVYNGRFDPSSEDILINTSEYDLSGLFPQMRIPTGLKVIELASGENFKGIEGVVRLPSLPERAYPESSALLYKEALEKFLAAEGLL